VEQVLIAGMDLVALEEIRGVKYRYLRCVDLKLWDELGETFTADATAEYGTQVGEALRFEGREAIVAGLRQRMTPDIVSVHTVAHPEITIDDDEATGIWQLTDLVIATTHRVVVTGAAYYRDRYLRTPDGWRIADTSYTRTYEALTSLADLPSFTLLSPKPTGGPR
jgi:hypothetical protein